MSVKPCQPHTTSTTTAGTTTTAPAPVELTGPPGIDASAGAPTCTSPSGQADVQVNWTSSNTDGVWTLTHNGYLMIDDPRTQGGRHIAKLGDTQFLFDCSLDTEYYTFRAYNATNYATDLLIVPNNLG